MSLLRQRGAGRKLTKRWYHFKLIWADGVYEDILAWVKQQFGWRLEIVRRPPETKGFQILPRRWVVERTFGWLGRYQRLGRDDEHQTLSSESVVYVASSHRMLKLLTCETRISKHSLRGLDFGSLFSFIEKSCKLDTEN